MANAARTDGGRRSVTVRVAGQEVRLRTGEDEVLAAEAAGLVNEEIGRAQKGKGAVAGGEALLLAALNLAGEVVRLRKASDDQGRETQAKLSQLLQKLSKVPANGV